MTALAFLLLFADLPPLMASNRNEVVVDRLSGGDRLALEQMTVLSSASLAEIDGASNAERLRERTTELLALDSLGIGTREVDQDGRAAIHRYLLDVFAGLEKHGLELLGSLRGEVYAPVSLDRLANPERREEPASVEVEGRKLPVHPLWPNGAMPSIAPAEGLRGHLVDAGHAGWDDLKGLDLKGAIALMDFEGGRNFERLFSLGVIAVIVYDGGHVHRESAEELFMNAPLPYPRFFAEGEAAAALRELATSGSGQTALLRGGNTFEARPVETFFTRLPAGEPVSVEMRESTLLDEIARQFEVSAGELMVLNSLDSPVLSGGDRLRIPRRDRTYTVRENDLLERLATRFGTPAEHILEFNGLEEEGLPGEGEIRIPNIVDPLLVLVPIDSVSVVPDMPHGAKTASNLAIALETLEHLATSPFTDRRKDVFFVFLDGDSVGGMASRMFAEYVLHHEGRLVSREGDAAEVRIDRYRRGLSWFEGEEPDADILRWLGSEWITSRLEDARVEQAERRIEGILALQDDPDPEERQHLQAVVRETERKLEYMLNFRLTTVENRQLGWRDRVMRLRERLRDPEHAPQLKEVGVVFEEMKAQFEAELAEEERHHRTHLHNLENMETVMEALNPGAEPGRTSTRLAWYFDFSSGSHTTGVTHWGTALYGRPIPAQNAGSQFARRFQSLLALAQLRGGWDEEWTFARQEDSLEFALLPVETPASYADLWAAGDVAVLPLGTLNDRLSRVDTPRDTIESVDFTNLSVQARNAMILLKAGLENPVDSRPPAHFNKPRLGRLTGSTVQFNIRSGIDAQEPVARSWVHYPAARSRSYWQALDDTNSSTYRGYRRGIIRASHLNGTYRLPVENLGSGRRVVFAYHFDRESGLFDKVSSRGQVGTQAQEPDFNLIEGTDSVKNIVMTDVYPLVVYGGVDPFNYKRLGRPPQNFLVIDAVLDGEPRYYSFENPAEDYHEDDVDGIVLFLPEGTRTRFVVQENVYYNMMLVGDVVDGKGRGHQIGPGPDGGRNLYLPLTAQSVAREMLGMARHRQEVYASFGISSRTIDNALRRAADKIAESEAAAAIGDWQTANGTAREAWGILVRFYPRVLDLGREAVFSVIMLMALLVPAAFFLERLLVGAKAIVARLAWAAGFFSLGVVFLNTFHPAFRIAVSPFIVVIAFVMILMSIIVLGLCYQRFDVLLRRARATGGEVESEEIGLSNSLATALSLGVSNLKKRPSRTILTVITVSVLTFSVVAFVSVTGTDRLFQRPLSLERDIEGRVVEPKDPAYEGVLFREVYWRAMPSSFVSAVRSEFGARYPMAARARYIETAGGEGAEIEGRNQIEIRRGDRAFIAIGVMAFEPEETEFTQLHRAVSGEHWFRGRDEGEPSRYEVILPDTAARVLRISEEDLLDEDGALLPRDELPEVRFMNHQWRVIGILDVEHADRIRDVNGKSAAMVDYFRSAFTDSQFASGDLLREPYSYHMSWARLPIVPMAARQDVNASMSSVAFRFDSEEDREAFFTDAALRLNRPMFSHVDGEVAMLTTRQERNVAGLAKVVVPVILCILIVMNTMMGTVEERKGEVGMLGAIGLSPRQISFLLLSESTVFSVLGIILGGFGGLFFANALQFMEAQGIGWLSGLSFNFTSMTSMALAFCTGAVVLVATLVPAMRAAALATPSGMTAWELPPPSGDNTIHFELPFTLTRGNAVGMVAFFRQFLFNHTEPTSADFNCRDITVSASEHRSGIEVGAEMWLAPYDLDVAQQFRMSIVPGNDEGIQRVIIVLRRRSGNEESWMQTNYLFMDLVRRQFLLWRNLAPESREQYIVHGTQLLRQVMSR